MIDTIEIIQDLIEEQTELLEMSAIENDCVQLGQVSVLEFLIDDMFTTMLEENELENHKIKVFPNPTKEILYIEVESSNFDIIIFDSKGLSIESFENQFNNMMIDFNDFNTGIYFVRINNKTNNRITTHKIVKK